MNKIILYGPLAEKYGSEFKLAVRDPIEAIRAMHVQLPGFLQMCEDHGYVACREFSNGTFAMSEEMLYLGMNQGTIHLLPSIDGANTKGIAKTVIGVALIIGSFFIPGGQVLLGIGLKTLALTVGMALAFSGLAMLIAPTPAINKDKTAKNDSFLFNGDTNTADQAIPVPVTYGLDRVTPIPIATKITTNQITVGQATDGSSSFGSGSTSTGTNPDTGTGVGGGDNFYQQKRF